MKGQEKLVRKIFNDMRNHNLSQSMILQGELGCGKHTLMNNICKYLGLECINITDMINIETIEQITDSPITRAYYIETQEIGVKEQNTILKLLEEPTERVYLFLLCENLSYLLPTITNRCRVYYFQPYTKQTLKEFTQDETILKYASTIGQIEQYKECDIKGIEALAEKVIDKIRNANYANILNISKSIKLKNNDNGYELSLFLKVMLICARDMFIKGELSYKPYMTIRDVICKQGARNINKQMLFESFLYEIKKSVVS